LGAGCRGITVGERPAVRSAKRLQQTARVIGEIQRSAVGVGNSGKLLIVRVIGQGLRIAIPCLDNIKQCGIYRGSIGLWRTCIGIGFNRIVRSGQSPGRAGIGERVSNIAVGSPGASV
jgi:hypothetical protein